MALEGKAGKLSRKLRDSDKKLNTIGRQAKRLKGKIRKQSQLLNELKNKKATTLERLGHQKTALRRNIVAQQKIQMGMNTSPLDSSDIGRKQRLEFWLKHLNKEHQNLIQQLKLSQEELTATEQNYQARLAESENSKSDLDGQKKELDKARRQQKALVKKLKNQKKKYHNKKQSLLQDQTRLKTLLEKLRFAEKHPDFSQDGKVSFRKLKGKLPWPIEGSAKKKRFSSGVSLDAKPGTRVRAITHGRVVFADWMKGYGLLIVIDHGEGYMSLYGQNETLFTKTGDWVEPGTVLASSGQSRSDNPSGIYFEIRKKAGALDPLKWCRAR